MVLYGEPSTSDEWNNMYNETQKELNEEANEGGVSTTVESDEIYLNQPKRTGKLNEDDDGAGESIDDLISDADDFVSVNVFGNRYKSGSEKVINTIWIWMFSSIWSFCYMENSSNDITRNISNLHKLHKKRKYDII